MIDGTYRFEVDLPVGRKAGTVAIRTNGDVASAEIDVPVIGKQRVEGRAEGDAFSAEGVFKQLLLGKIDYRLHGRVEGDDLSISIESSKGNFELAGTRI